MKSIRDIKEEFQTAVDLETKEKLAQSYQTDSRKGVQDLIARVYPGKGEAAERAGASGGDETIRKEICRLYGNLWN